MFSCINIQRFVVFFIALVATSGFAETNSPSATSRRSGAALDSVTLQLPFYHQFEFAGFYAAVEKGFYEEEGLSVLLQENQKQTSTVDLVLNEEADFGISGPNLLVDRVEGKTVVALAVIFQRSPFSLIVKSNSPVLKPADLIGRKIMANSLSLPLQAMFLKTGVPLADIKLVPQTWELTDLIEGKVDALQCYRASQPYELRHRDIPVRIISALAYGVDFYGDTLFTSEKQIKEHPGRVAAFHRASLRGWEYAVDHPAEAVSWILKKYGGEKAGLTEEQLTFEADATRKVVRLKRIEIGNMTRVQWESMVETLAQVGLIKTNASLDGFVYEPPLKSDSSFLRSLLKVAVGILAILAAVLVWSVRRRLNERREAAADLQRQKDFSKNLIDSSVDGILAYDMKCNYTAWNPAMEKMSGLPASKVLGQCAFEIFPFLKETGEDIFFKESLAGKTVTAKNRYYKTPANKEGWFEGHYSPIYNEEKQIVGGLAIIRETSERKKAEQELRESEERFSRAFLSSPVPMTLSSLQEGLYLDVNDSMLRLIGYSREEMIGRTSLDLGIWVMPEVRAEMLQKLKEQNSVHEMRCEFRTKSGSIRTVLLSVELLNFGTNSNILVLIYDITDRLNLEEQLRQSQKMESFGQLAAGVAHDFNNILNIILGYADLLTHSGKIEDTEKESLQHISTAAERAAHLTRQLLTFSRKQVMQLKALNLNDVVSNMTSMLARILGENITVQFNYSSTESRVYADASMIEQIVLNLALNARDAMPNGGKLTIRIASQKITDGIAHQNPDARNGEFVCLTISDNGVGIPAEILPRIFEPFFTTKEVGKGTGLGLATVYGIVKQHEGWMNVESEVDQGTTFKIFLPTYRDRIELLSESSPLAKVKGGSETILIVEDEPALRQLAEDVLRMYGYRVFQASNGHEAISIWEQHGSMIDLLLTDMMMPGGVGGRDLARQLQQERNDLKVIYISGYSVDIIGADLNLQPGVNFLQKPFFPVTLAKAVRDCLDNNSVSAQVIL